MAKERHVNTSIELCAGDDRPAKVRKMVAGVHLIYYTRMVMMIIGIALWFSNGSKHFPKVPSKFIATSKAAIGKSTYQFHKVGRRGNQNLMMGRDERFLGGKDACKV